MILNLLLTTLIAKAEPTAQQAATPSTPEAASAVAQPAAPALSFSEAYARILERNLEVRSQGLSVDIARAKKLGRVGAFTPRLALVGTASQQTTGDLVDYQGNRTGTAQLSANLFRSGADFAALKGSNRDVDAAEETLKDQKLKAEDDAVKTLIDFISKTRTRELILQIVQLKQESIKIARERYSRGLLPSQEVDKTQIDLDNSQARLIDSEVALADARANVSARLGASQNVNLDWPWKGAIVSGPRPEQIEFKLENRPDFRSALQTVEAEDWRRHAARSLLLPSLDLFANYGSLDLQQPGRRDWAATLTLTIPLFERFEGWSVARQQSLVKQQAEITREAITRNAGAEIESYKVAFTEARESATARERTAKLTNRLFTDNLQRFRLGRASANELAIDQQRLLDAEILEVEGWATAHLSFVRLCHALGRTVQADGACQGR